MSSSKWRPLALPLLGAALLSSCAVDDDTPIAPVPPAPGGELFDRYVAMGNSITAGLQSAGINDSLQLLSYPNLLARQAGADFALPLLNKPGCPAPFLAPLGQGGTLGGPTAPACALRSDPVAAVVQNVAVPGAQIADALSETRVADPTNTFNRLQLFFLGGRSMVEATRHAEPTLVSMWLGNNDVLGAVLAGNAAALTSEAAFTQALDAIVAELKTISTLQDVVVIGVVNSNVVPLYQPGAYFFLSRDPATGQFQGKPVNANCSPVNQLGQPNPLAANQVSFAIVSNAGFPEINCDPAAYPAGDPRRGALLLDAQEQQQIAARTQAFNAVLQQRAQQNGWIFVDPNPVLLQLAAQRDAQGRYQNLRKCQGLATAQTAAQFQAAVLTSCPVPPTGATAAFAAPNFFGALISYDGLHPSSQAHVVVTNLLIDAINAKHQLSIPRI